MAAARGAWGRGASARSQVSLGAGKGRLQAVLSCRGRAQRGRRLRHVVCARQALRCAARGSRARICGATCLGLQGAGSGTTPSSCGHRFQVACWKSVVAGMEPGGCEKSK